MRGARRMDSEEGAALPTVADALMEARSALEAHRAQVDSELEELDEEIAEIEAAVRKLQEQLGSLARHRENLLTRRERSGDACYRALYQTLGRQAEALAVRAEQMAARREEQSSAQTGMDEAEVERLLDEYRTFKKTIAPNLAELPESYRGVLSSHHEEVVARLREHFAEQLPPVVLEAAPLPVDVVFAVDPPEGHAELLMFVLPVREQAFEGWRELGDGVELYLATRVAQGVFQALVELDLRAILPAFGGHQGVLVIEAEIPAMERQAVLDRVHEVVDAVLRTADELAAARVEARISEVPVGDVFPAEEEEDGG